MPTLNETHEPQLRSWIDSANNGTTDFPIQNLPFALFRHRESNQQYRGGVAIGDQIIDLAKVSQRGVFSGESAIAVAACAEPSLNTFMAMSPTVWSALRLSLSQGLREGATLMSDFHHCLVAQADAEYAVPAHIGDYTDFYTSIHHATNIGKLFRPDNPLMPNYQWIPIGYHGRSSSIAVSGTDFHRPKGQTKALDQDEPEFGACKKLDYEMEVGIFVGSGNKLGQAVKIDDADNHVFGLCLLNDWSARDIQAWEYQPLGPFLSKNFISTISPWIVTIEALAPYRSTWSRPADHPQPLAYLESEQNRKSGGYDIQLEVLIETNKMRQNKQAASRLSLSNFNHSYWTVAQMLAHHTVNGCNLRAGDFLGSGTMSGPGAEAAGALIELSKGGKQAITLANGEQRTFLEDGDAIIMRGWAENTNAVRIGFGEVASKVLPAISQ